ncbi:hypothetical protein Swoo_4883 [Shewanella woodyi ATCC 51908]|uniref:Uncharacterized protein n=1 Tax=Shewanella woodyi (strain ATCC 51908 / MS32) TaxID=392500 RepID=B1KQ19_SHEWM|nr:hypothetical protein Swoo_4883 [Shewanella woodyi ATCC 51908]
MFVGEYSDSCEFTKQSWVGLALIKRRTRVPSARETGRLSLIKSPNISMDGVYAKNCLEQF